jgi:hypothetical protein
MLRTIYFSKSKEVVRLLARRWSYGNMELDSAFVESFHSLSTVVIAAIVLLSIAVSFFVFKHFDHDFWNSDSYGD